MAGGRSGRYLMAVIDGGGTLPPALGLARELVRRGHSVDVLADPTAEASALSAGCRFLPWRTAPRVGFGWDVMGDGRTAVRGGFGTSYNRLGDGQYGGRATESPAPMRAREPASRSR